MMNDIKLEVNERQRLALTVLAHESGIERDGGCGRIGLDRFVPTPLGWQRRESINWRYEYARLERACEDLQREVESLKAVNRKYKKLTKELDTKTLLKVEGILNGHSTDKVRDLKRYLNL